jgi:uncharacterized protein (DUF2141 family)
MKKHTVRSVLAAGFLLLFLTAWADELFRIEGTVRCSEEGMVYLQIVDRNAFRDDTSGFSRGAMIRTYGGERSTYPFLLEEIPPGTYGIRAFLDINGNEKIDFSLRGIEPWGTYLPVRPRFRGPRFNEIAFELTGNRRDILVEIK